MAISEQATQLEQIKREHIDPNQVTPRRKPSYNEKIEKTEESTFSTTNYTGSCAQSGSYNYLFAGDASPLPNSQRYNGEITLKTLKDASETGSLPNDNWIRTADEILNPAIRAGYYSSAFVITSTYRPGGSLNHRSLGAIDISMGYSESKDDLLLNLCFGIIKLGLPFDKLLLETDGSKTSAWVHVQCAKSPPTPLYKTLTCRNASCTINNGNGIDINFLRGR